MCGTYPEKTNEKVFPFSQSSISALVGGMMVPAPLIMAIVFLASGGSSIQSILGYSFLGVTGIGILALIWFMGDIYFVVNKEANTMYLYKGRCFNNRFSKTFVGTCDDFVRAELLPGKSDQTFAIAIVTKKTSIDVTPQRDNIDVPAKKKFVKDVNEYFGKSGVIVANMSQAMTSIENLQNVITVQQQQLNDLQAQQQQQIKFWICLDFLFFVISIRFCFVFSFFMIVACSFCVICE